MSDGVMLDGGVRGSLSQRTIRSILDTVRVVGAKNAKCSHGSWCILNDDGVPVLLE